MSATTSPAGIWIFNPQNSASAAPARSQNDLSHTSETPHPQVKPRSQSQSQAKALDGMSDVDSQQPLEQWAFDDFESSIPTHEDMEEYLGAFNSIANPAENSRESFDHWQALYGQLELKKLF